MEFLTVLDALTEDARRMDAVVRMTYRSDDQPTTHVEVFASPFHFELCGPLQDLDRMCNALRAALHAVEAMDVPF